MFDRPLPRGVLPQVADLLGAPLEHITAGHIRAAVDAGVGETVHLDWKRDLYPWHGSGGKAKEHARAEVVKDVAALANTEGGVIVIGVDEDEGRASGASPVDLGEGFGQWVRQQLAGSLHPHLGEVSIGRLEDHGGRGFVVVVVPPGPLRPYGRQATADVSLSYFHRVGTDNRQMTEAEVRRAYARAEARAVDRITIGPALFDELALDWRGWLLVTVVPFAPGSFPVSAANMAAIDARTRSDTVLARAGAPQPSRVNVGGFVRRYPAAHDLGLGGSVDFLDSVLESLRDDGSFASAWTLTSGPDERRELVEGPRQISNARGPLIERIYVSPDRLLGMLVGSLRCGFGHVRAAGAYGFAHVSVTMASGIRPRALERDEPDAFEVRGVDDRASTLVLPETPGLPVPIPVAIPDVGDDRGLLLAVRDAAAPLVQRLGVPEYRPITTAGELAATFVDRHRGVVRAGLPLEGAEQT